MGIKKTASVCTRHGAVAEQGSVEDHPSSLCISSETGGVSVWRNRTQKLEKQKSVRKYVCASYVLGTVADMADGKRTKEVLTWVLSCHRGVV